MGPDEEGMPSVSEFLDSPMRLTPVNTYKPSAHTSLVGDCIKSLAKLPGWHRTRKRPVGRFILADNDEHGNPVPRRFKGRRGMQYATIQVGKAGEADIELLWKPPLLSYPLLIVIECKTGRGVLSKDQEDYFADTKLGGGFCIQARDVRGMLDQVIKIGAIACANGKL